MTPMRTKPGGKLHAVPINLVCEFQRTTTSGRGFFSDFKIPGLSLAHLNSNIQNLLVPERKFSDLSPSKPIGLRAELNFCGSPVKTAPKSLSGSEATAEGRREAAEILDKSGARGPKSALPQWPV